MTAHISTFFRDSNEVKKKKLSFSLITIRLILLYFIKIALKRKDEWDVVVDCCHRDALTRRRNPVTQSGTVKKRYRVKVALLEAGPHTPVTQCDGFTCN